jgi:hypothetical protein
MTTENDILFDDFSILTKLTGKSTLINLSPNSDCDCTGYSSTSNQDNFETHQIPASSGQTN